MVTFEVAEEKIKEVLQFLKTESNPRFLRLDDLTAIDESARRRRGDFDIYNGTVGKEIGRTSLHPPDQQAYPDYTMVYHLLSFEPAGRLRLKVPLYGKDPVTQTVTDIWPSADWYEREVFDLFGIGFQGHPNLQRILLPHDWEGHPLRKSYPGRATEMPAYTRAEAEKYQPLEAGVMVRKQGAEWTGDVIKPGTPSPRRPRIDALCPFFRRRKDL